MKKKKIAIKVALMLVLCMTLVLSMASCGGNNIQIDTTNELSYWAGTTAEEPGDVVEGGEEGTGEVDTPTAESGPKKEVIIEAEKGFIDNILSWIGIALAWITRGMPGNSYILTLLIFAIIIEVIFLPFGIKQQKNSIKQAKLKPKEMAIRKKYAGRNDQVTQQKVTQEIQELYQKENFSPLSGCLPMLIQLPVILVLYWIVVNPVKYVLNCSGEFISFMYRYLESIGQTPATNGTIQLLNKITQLWNNSPEVFDNIKNSCANPDAVLAQIEKMANPDTALNFNIGALDFSEIPSFNFGSVNAWLLLIPVLTFVVYFFSMKINRKLSFQPTQNADERQQACSNNMMDITMPLMSVYITFIVPAAIGVYWMFKSILGVVKQFILSKAMPLPKFTEEDYKAAEKEMLGKQPKKIQKSENVGKVRSLHHIDDDDYDENGNYAPKPVEAEEEAQTETKTELPENKMTEGATLKDESDKKASKDNKKD